VLRSEIIITSTRFETDTLRFGAKQAVPRVRVIQYMMSQLQDFPIGYVVDASTYVSDALDCAQVRWKM
jgi:hypothetical protein